MKNTISFSFSRKSTFDTCKRQYFLNYYGSRNGWFKSSPDRTKETYYLKKLSNIYTWAGNIVHDIIQGMLVDMRDSGKRPDLDEAIAKTKSMLKDQYRESHKRAKLWESKQWGWTKLFGLKEHAFGEGVPKDKRVMVKDRIISCLTNFFSSDIYQNIINSDPANWKSIDEFSTFRIPLDSGFKIPVYSVPDFAMLKDGKLYIYDWKTGKENPKYKEQLSLYAVYAKMFWNVEPENIVCDIFYMLPNKVVRVDISPDTVEKMISGIKSGATEMIAMLQNGDPVADQPLEEEEYPLTSNRSGCFFCTFSSICGING